MSTSRQTSPIEFRNGNMSTTSSTAEAIALPASPAHSPNPAEPMAFQSHGKSLSMASEFPPPTRSNRFSLQFPIQPSGTNTPSRTTSPVREPAPAIPVADALAALSNGTPDNSSFLTLIACQERRVLELKEELQKAEADLDKLKRQWGRHEVQRKKDDVKRITKLQPLQTTIPAQVKEDDEDGSNAWMQQEMQRRKLLLSRSNTTGGRTIVPGGRHTRALSLLAPARDNLKEREVRDTAARAPQRPAPPHDTLKNSTRQSMEVLTTHSERPTVIRHASDAPDLMDELNRSAGLNMDVTQRANIDQEALLRTGKKMATDFKDGLWTFWEDLRQATVGEESHQIPPPHRKSSTQTAQTPKGARKQSSRNSLRPSSRGSASPSQAQKGFAESNAKQPSPNKKQAAAGQLPDLADPSFWAEYGVPTPTQQHSVDKCTPAPTKKSAGGKHAKSPSEARMQVSQQRLSAVSNNDAWDTWDDSPEQSRTNSSVTSETNTVPSTVSDSGSPRNSDDTTAKRDPIPWPALNKTGLGTLKRTASTLMREWEKSLIPSPSSGSERGNGGGGDYMGASAEAAAYGAAKGD